MKKYVFFILLLLAGVSVFARDVREVRIFVPPIAGFGSLSDNAFFYRRLSSEVFFSYYTPVRSQRVCDFVLRASILPMTEGELPVFEFESPVPERPFPPIKYSQGRHEFFSWEINDNIFFFNATEDDNLEVIGLPDGYSDEPGHFLYSYDELVLLLELINNSNGQLIGRQQLIYTTIDDSVGDLLSIIVYNMLAGIPEIEETDKWRNNWLFYEISALYAPRIYTINDTASNNLMNFGVKTGFELHFLKFLSLGAGVQVVQEFFVDNANNEYSDFILEVPLALKLVFKPGRNLMLEPYGGILFSYSLMDTFVPSSMSWFAGLSFGFKAGAGMLVIDPRYSQDLDSLGIAGTNIQIERTSFQLGLGYKIGFARKRTKLDY